MLYFVHYGYLKFSSFDILSILGIEHAFYGHMLKQTADGRRQTDRYHIHIQIIYVFNIVLQEHCPMSYNEQTHVSHMNKK